MSVGDVMSSRGVEGLPSPRMDRRALVRELIVDEGLRLKPYLDTVNKISIGVGRNLTDVGISETEAMYLLDHDIDRTVSGLLNAVPWWVDLDAVRQRVLANLAFNLGVGGLLTFHDTLRAVANGDYPRAADEMLSSLWARQVGDRAKRLAAMMLTGTA